MAENASPLAFQDLFGRVHIEPSVTGLILTQQKESPRSVNPNDVIELAAFRSGTPNVLRRFSSMAALRNVHDPDNNNDLGVALAGATRDPFGDDGVFGSADILTVRVGTPTPATSIIASGGTQLVQITTADYGRQTNRCYRRLTADSPEGLKLVLRDENNTKRVFTGRNLGPLLTVHYTGDAGACAVSVRVSNGVISYTGQPDDGDTVTVNGIIFEFDSNSAVSAGHVSVAIGASAADTYAALATAIGAQAGVNTTTASGAVHLESVDLGVALVVAAHNASGAMSGSVVALALTLSGTAPTDGSQSWVFPLTISSYGTITQLVAQINGKASFTAALPAYANSNPFLASTALDALAATDCKTSTVTLTGTAAAIADWVNSRTQGNYTAQVLGQNLEPDADTADVAFTGGTTPAAVTIDDYVAALDIVGSEVQLGGILILDTTDEAVMAAVVAFIADQQARGKWFRACFGAASYDELGSQVARAAKFGQIASGLDASRTRLYAQRLGVFGTGGAIEYVSPLSLAASMAGGIAGNLPYVNPLTNKRLRYVDIHPDDRFDEDTRAQLLQAGVTVIKREGASRVVTLAVTTSQDPDRRMNRVMSERDTVDLIDANMRQAFLPFRGKWANLALAATVTGVMKAVLDPFVRAGAIAKGIDPVSGKAVPAWEGLPVGPNGESWVLAEGVLQIRYRIFVPGELNHISLFGTAEYVALAGSVGGSNVELSTTVPV